MSLRIKNDKKINDLLSLVKLFYLLCIFMYIFYIKNTINPLFVLDYIVYSIIGLSTTYIFWVYFIQNKLKKRFFNLFLLIENIIFIPLVIIVILTSGAHESEFKFLFILIILISSVECKIKHSILISIICSISLLTIDLIYGSNTTTNISFEKDLILSGIFIFTALIISYFVNLAKINLDHLEGLLDSEKYPSLPNNTEKKANI